MNLKIICMVTCLLLSLGTLPQGLSISFSKSSSAPDLIVELEIGEITGGFTRVQAEIQNQGDEDAQNIAWDISITGGLLGRLDATSTGNLAIIPAGSRITVQSDPLVGIGDITVKVTVDTIEKTVTGTIFIFVITINSGLSLEFITRADGLTSPVLCTNAGDGSNRLFIGDQTGIISVIDTNGLQADPFLDITAKVVPLDTIYDERGLLGLTFHPNYETTGRFYVYYSANTNRGDIDHESILAEYRVTSDNPNKADPSTEKILLRIDQPELNHNGGQIEFGPDGYLYIGVGDGGGAGDQHGIMGNGQNITTLLGSILRIDVDAGDPYGIPATNPFVGLPGKDEIYAYGFRNPWKFSFDRETGRLIVADVGQDEWEEIDIVESGGNYGWRILEGTHPYDLDLADLLDLDISTLKSPIHEYSHDIGKSITGGYLYRGSQSPKLVGKYVFGDWSSSFLRANGQLFYLEELEPGRWERFEFQLPGSFERFVTAFGEDENGEIYVLSKTMLGPTGTTGDVRQMVVP